MPNRDRDLRLWKSTRLYPSSVQVAIATQAKHRIIDWVMFAHGDSRLDRRKQVSLKLLTLVGIRNCSTSRPPVPFRLIFRPHSLPSYPTRRCTSIRRHPRSHGRTSVAPATHAFLPRPSSPPDTPSLALRPHASRSCRGHLLLGLCQTARCRCIQRRPLNRSSSRRLRPKRGDGASMMRSKRCRDGRRRS
jgi:hypothetical protein